MMEGLFGKKIGMTHVFGEDNLQVAVTLVEIEPATVVSIQTTERNGYEAVLFGSGKPNEKKIQSSFKGIFAKAGVDTQKNLFELRKPANDLKVGDVININLFEGAQKVTIKGKSKGHGFAGTVKRYGFKTGPRSHGSKNVREPGSLGAHSYPARVFPGKKLGGHYGDARVTVRNVKLVKIDVEKNLLYLGGSVPGAVNSRVFIRK